MPSSAHTAALTAPSFLLWAWFDILFSDSSTDILPWAICSDCCKWLWFHTSQNYLPTFIFSALTHNLAVFLGEQRLNIYLLIHIFLVLQLHRATRLFFCLKNRYFDIRKDRGRTAANAKQRNATLTLQQCWRCLPFQDFPDTSLCQLAHRKTLDGHQGRLDNHCLQIPTHRNWVKGSEFKGCIYKTRLRKDYLPAGISASRPEISLRASAHREVESAIILTW